MKNKIFTQKLLAVGTLAALGLAFTSGVQAQESYAVSKLEITSFATIFDPIESTPQDLQGNLVTSTNCLSDLAPNDDSDGQNVAQAFASFALIPPTLDADSAECGNTNNVRGENNFNPIGPQPFSFGSGDAEIEDTNTLGSGIANTIGESYSNDFSEPLKSFTGDGRNTLASEFTLTEPSTITFSFDAAYLAYAQLNGNVNGQSLADAASSFSLIVTNVTDRDNPQIVPGFPFTPPELQLAATQSISVGDDGSLIVANDPFAISTPQLEPGIYTVEIVMESRATVKVDEQPPLVFGDHFLCYKSFGHFLREEVGLFDQFDEFDESEAKTFDVLKPKMFCNPAIKPELDPEAVLEPGPHYLSYKINEGHRVPRHERKIAQIENQFGSMIVETLKPDRLMVPSGKSLDLTQAPGIPVASDKTNHYKCYSVRPSGGFQSPGDVAVLDQFTDEDGKRLRIIRPTRLCVPVEKTRSDGTVTPIILDPDNEFDHQMCYSVSAARGERFNRKTNILSNNQFRSEELVLKRELEFCVPSKKTLLVPEG